MNTPELPRRPTRLRSSAALALGVGLFLGLVMTGCGRPGATTALKGPGGQTYSAPVSAAGYRLDLPAGGSRAGTAVVVLMDTSGSMGQPVRGQDGKQHPKHQLAREALDQIIQQTGKWKKEHPNRVLQLGIYNFSSSVQEILPVGDFDEAKARKALDRLPKPNSGTAIGVALEQGAKALYRSGCARKYLVCVTDGENTTGVAPAAVARQLHAQTGGGVELHFVAFDTAASHFNFLKEVNGHVVQADDGPQLQAELARIYDQRILVEKEEPPK